MCDMHHIQLHIQVENVLSNNEPLELEEKIKVDQIQNLLWLCCCGCGLSRADEWWTYCGRTTDYGGTGKYIGMLTEFT